MRQRKSPQKTSSNDKAHKDQSAKVKPRQKSAKLSYKDQRELDKLPSDIADVEKKIEAVQADMASPEFYLQDTIAEVNAELENLEQKLERCFERWEELEAKKEALETGG